VKKVSHAREDDAGESELSRFVRQSRSPRSRPPRRASSVRLRRRSSTALLALAVSRNRTNHRREAEEEKEMSRDLSFATQLTHVDAPQRDVIRFPASLSCQLEFARLRICFCASKVVFFPQKLKHERKRKDFQVVSSLSFLTHFLTAKIPLLLVLPKKKKKKKKKKKISSLSLFLTFDGEARDVLTSRFEDTKLFSFALAVSPASSSPSLPLFLLLRLLFALRVALVGHSRLRFSTCE
jgi:hypothetical protein